MRILAAHITGLFIQGDIMEDLFIMGLTFITGVPVITLPGITMRLYIIIGITAPHVTAGTGKTVRSPGIAGASYLIMTGSITGHFNNYGIEAF